MKKLIAISAAVLLMIPVLTGCKKDKEKDNGNAIKNKVWVGTFNAAGKPEQYYSVRFNADSTLLFSSFSADYQGNWKLTGKQLTINAVVSATATISDDNKLADITNLIDITELKSGALNDRYDLKLDNTTWQGTLSGSPGELVFSFKPGLMVEARYGVTVLYNGPYERVDAGIRFVDNDGPGFGVIMPDGNEIKGRYVGNIQTSWQVVKQ